MAFKFLSNLRCLGFSCRFLTTCALQFCLWHSRSDLMLLSENSTARDALATLEPLMITSMKEKEFCLGGIIFSYWLPLPFMFVRGDNQTLPTTAPQSCLHASTPIASTAAGYRCRRRALRVVALSCDNHLHCSPAGHQHHVSADSWQNGAANIARTLNLQFLLWLKYLPSHWKIRMAMIHSCLMQPRLPVLIHFNKINKNK